MKMQEIVEQRAIIPALRSSERNDVIAELIDALVAAGAAPQESRDELFDAIIQRETRGSTGFGKGVAVPHVKHPAVTKMTAAIGISSGGVDFNALDKQPVYTVFLLLSPAGKPEEHLQAMEVIFKNLSMENFRRFLRQAETVEEVWTTLHDADHGT
jgi:mannitol/fructose-specific phosphotransferase system IIA component (Ntr-type)